MKSFKPLLAVVCAAGVAAFTVPSLSTFSIAQEQESNGADRPGAQAAGVHTNLEAKLKSVRQIVIKDEYKIGEVEIPAENREGREGGDGAGVKELQVNAIVAYEQRQEDQRVRGIEVRLRQNGQEVVSYIDPGEIGHLIRGLTDLSAAAAGERLNVGDDRRREDDNRDRPRERRRERDRGRDEEDDRSRDAGDRRAMEAREMRFSTADLAVIVRRDDGGSEVTVQNPNVSDSAVGLLSWRDARTLDQLKRLIEDADRVLQTK